MITPLLTVQIHYERDVVLSRKRARQISEFLGFEQQDQVRIATSVSEIGRNIFQYAKQGKIEFLYDKTRSALQIICSDKGPGIKNLKAILDGHYVSKTGMGLGLLGAGKLMDRCDIESSPTGTRILMEKIVPLPPLLHTNKLDQFLQKISGEVSEDPFFEIQRQNQELISTLALLAQRQTELDQLNKVLEDRVQERTASLNETNAQLESFVYSMAHDLRAPIRSMKGFSDALIDDFSEELPPDAQRYLNRISTNAQKMDHLIQDLLKFCRISRQEIVLENVNLLSCIHSTLEDSNFHMAKDAHAFSIRVPEDIFVRAHPLTLQQSLANLFTNAVKFVAEGVEPSIQVTASVSGKRIRLSVKDNGIGIESKHHEKVFKVFERIHETYAGTGIGLAIVRRAMERMDGSVSIDSDSLPGTTFCIELGLGENQ